MSAPANDPNPLSPHDALPPIEPPSPRFIVQLFLVPAVIVTIIVVVWLLINNLAHMGSDPTKLVDAIKRNNHGRWQAASTLADELRKDGNSKLKQDRNLSSSLKQLLESEIAKQDNSESALDLRKFLCYALGEMQTPDVPAALVIALEKERDDQQDVVRRAALTGMAVYLSGRQQLPAESLAAEPLPPAVGEQLLEASRDSNPMIRAAATYAIGFWESPLAVERLRVLLHDVTPAVRYNAAAALSRVGDASGVEVLVEMLDPTETLGVADLPPTAQAVQREVLIYTALKATQLLVEHKASFDAAPLREVIQQLLTTPIEIPGGEMTIEYKYNEGSKNDVRKEVQKVHHKASTTKLSHGVEKMARDTLQQLGG